VVKGLALRHLRWWGRRPIYQPDGALSIGYGYPNLNMAEQYNSPGSPYWALKYFLPLALPESHPFWQAEEAPLPDLAPVHALPHAGMIICRDRQSRHVCALASGQYALWTRHGAEKYAKFAYSTAFGFSVPSGRRGLEQLAPDSALALSDDGVHYRVREQPLDARIEDGVLRSRWQPWPGVEVETWLIPSPPWHLRIHWLRSDRPLWSAEGGFALDRTGDDPLSHAGVQQAGAGFAYAGYPAGWSGLRDLQGQRVGQVLRRCAWTRTPTCSPRAPFCRPCSASTIPAITGWPARWLAWAAPRVGRSAGGRRRPIRGLTEIVSSRKPFRGPPCDGA
jgi:hypothetical protein